MRYGCKFILLYVDILLSQHHLLKSFLFPLNGLDENGLIINVKADFWTLSSILLIYVCPHASTTFVLKNVAW